MSAVFDRLLSANNLPRYLRKDPDSIQAMTLTYTGTSGVVTVDHHHLITSVRGGSGSNLNIDLQSYATITALVTFLNTQTGYTAASIAGNAPALSLIEVVNQSIISPLVMSVFTSVLWQLLYPIAWLIEESIANGWAGLDETSIESADGWWLDNWGDIYGKILRLVGETDDQYRIRIPQEVGRPRLNKTAVQNALNQQVAGVATVVSDNQHDAVWVMGDPLGKILIDRIHCWDTIWVQW